MKTDGFDVCSQDKESSMEKMERLGYKNWNNAKPDREIEAEMTDEQGTEFWIGQLGPVHTSGRLPFWWRPARGKDDLWQEIMMLREMKGGATGDHSSASASNTIH
jgi:hypothetical protein